MSSSPEESKEGRGHSPPVPQISPRPSITGNFTQLLRKVLTVNSPTDPGIESPNDKPSLGQTKIITPGLNLVMNSSTGGLSYQSQEVAASLSQPQPIHGTQAGENMAHIDDNSNSSPDTKTVVDSYNIVVDEGDLTLLNAPLDKRLAAIRRVVDLLKGAELRGGLILWNAVDDILKLSQTDSQARLVMLQLLKAMSSAWSLEEEGDDCLKEIRSQMLQLIYSSNSWDELVLSASCIGWASDSGRYICENEPQWLDKLYSWMWHGINACYPNGKHKHVGIRLSPIYPPITVASVDCDCIPSEGSDIFMRFSETFIGLITYSYPCLDEKLISLYAQRLCHYASEIREQDDNAVWVWSQPIHVKQTLEILKASISLGSMSPNAMFDCVYFLTLAVSLDNCKVLAGCIVRKLLTSWYLNDTIESMTFILSKLTDGTFVDKTEKAKLEVSLEGIVYFLTDLMGDEDQVLDFTVCTTNFLPVLGGSIKNESLNVSYHILRYLVQVVKNPNLSQLSLTNWNILFNIMDGIASHHMFSSGFQNIQASQQLGPSEQEPTTNIGDRQYHDITLFRSAISTYKEILLGAVNSVRHGSYKGSLSRLCQELYSRRELLDDEMAIALLRFDQKRGALKPGTPNWLERTNELTKCFYHDHKKGIPLRAEMIDIINSSFKRVPSLYSPEVGRKLIAGILETVPHENDPTLVNCFVPILEGVLQFGSTDLFDIAIRISCSSIEKPNEPISPNLPMDTSNNDHSSQSPTNAPNNFVPLERHGGKDLHQTLPSTYAETHGRYSRFSSDSNADVSTLQSDIAEEEALPIFNRVCIITRCLSVALETRLSSSFDTLLSMEEPSTTWSLAWKKQTLSLINMILNSIENPNVFTKTRYELLKVLLRLRATSSGNVYILPEGQSELRSEQKSLLLNTIRVPLLNKRLAPLEKVLGITNVSGPAGIDSKSDDVLFSLDRYISMFIWILKNERRHKIFKTALLGLSTQLGNTYFFSGAKDVLEHFIIVLIKEIDNSTLGANLIDRPEREVWMNTYVGGYRVLTAIIHYRFLFKKSITMSLVPIFMEGLLKGKRFTARPCIHALSICMLELENFRNYVHVIVSKYIRVLNTTEINVHIIDSVSSLARNPFVLKNLTANDYKDIFGIATRCIRNYHDSKRKRTSTLAAQKDMATASSSAVTSPNNNARQFHSQTSSGISSPNVAPSNAASFDRDQLTHMGIPPNKPRETKPPRNPTVYRHQRMGTEGVDRRGSITEDFRYMSSRAQPNISSVLSLKIEQSQADITLDQYVLTMAYQVFDMFYNLLNPKNKMLLFDRLLHSLLSINFDEKRLDMATEVCLDMMLMGIDLPCGWTKVFSLEKPNHSPDHLVRSWLHCRGVIQISAERNGQYGLITIRRSSGMIQKRVNLVDIFLSGKDHVDLLTNAVEKGEDSSQQQRPKTPPLGKSNESISPQGSLGRSSAMISLKNRPPFMQGTGMSIANNQIPPTHYSSKEPIIGNVKHLLRGNMVAHGKSEDNVTFYLGKDEKKSFFDSIVTAYPGMGILDPPMLIPENLDIVNRSINLLDKIPVIDTHKVAVLYVGPGQKHETEILQNTMGSRAYWAFIKGLGEIRKLTSLGNTFHGGLDTSGQEIDGRYCVSWQDEMSRLIFHVATLLPNDLKHDPNCNGKKRHIGNDYVHIIFNDSSLPYDFDTIPSEFNYVQIIITPTEDTAPMQGLDEDQPFDGEHLYSVITKTRENMPPIGPAMNPKLLTLTALPSFVRTTAIHSILFIHCYINCVVKEGLEFNSNWTRRLDQIKRIGQHIAKDHQQKQNTPKPSPTARRESTTLITRSRAQSTSDNHNHSATTGGHSVYDSATAMLQPNTASDLERVLSGADVLEYLISQSPPLDSSHIHP